MSVAKEATSCCRCDEPAFIRQGHVLYCVKHYRFSTMRTAARRDGKAVPDWSELETLVPPDMRCIGCAREMRWRAETNGAKAGASTLITLQHDRSGAFRLICLGCNTRHAQHPGDTFYDIPAGHKRCPDCETVKPVSDFAVDRSRPIGRKSYCKECSRVRHASWAIRRADAMLAERERAR